VAHPPHARVSEEYVPETPSRVTRCDRQVFDRLKALHRDTLKRELGKYLDDGQIVTLLSRRDLIVQKIEGLGPAALFDHSPRVRL